MGCGRDGLFRPPSCRQEDCSPAPHEANSRAHEVDAPGFVSTAAAPAVTGPKAPLRGALVIGAETFSRLLDWEDRTTCVLFGDGAGAIVLEGESGGDRGVLHSRLHADGRHNQLLYVDGGPSTTGTVGKLRMKGKEVFRHAVVNLASVMGESLAAAGLDPADVDWVVPHQAMPAFSTRRTRSWAWHPKR